MHGGEVRRPNGAQGLGKLLLGLPGEPADQIGGDGGPVKVLPQQAAGRQKALRRVLPVHPLQGGVAARLEGQMEVGTQVVQLCRPAAERLGDGAGLQTAQPDAQPGRGTAHRLGQVNEGLRAAVQVLAPAGDFDPRDHDLPVACLRQRFALRRRRRNGGAAHRTPGKGDDAVGAEGPGQRQYRYTRLLNLCKGRNIQLWLVFGF